eukprot:jgi/Hompol1/2815/HPOL_003031-RA
MPLTDPREHGNALNAHVCKSDSAESVAQPTTPTEDKLTLCGFEGPEKLLEIWFESSADENASEHHPNHSDNSDESDTSSLSDCEKPAHHYASSAIADTDGHFHFHRLGLRSVSRAVWEDMLNIVQCRVLSVIKNEFADAFLLSESSMFVYENRIMLKTCGTTTLLHALPRILQIAKEMCGLSEIKSVFYSRKAFLFPERQAWPHGKWGDEVAYLDGLFPSDQFDTSGYVVGKINGDHWCLYTATPAGMDMDGNPIKTASAPTASVSADHSRHISAEDDEDDVTLEILMTHLDPEAMKVFWRTEKEMADAKLAVNKGKPKHHFEGPEHRVFTQTGISEIYPDSIVDDYVFDPCGYSLNGLLGPYYYTIHVTPEDICSYASFETTIPVKQFMPKHGRDGIESEYNTFNDVVQKVVERFKPGRFSTTLFVRHTAVNKLGLGRSQLLSGQISGFRRRDRIVHTLAHHDFVYANFEKHSNVATKPAIAAVHVAAMAHDSETGSNCGTDASADTLVDQASPVSAVAAADR